MLHTVPDSCVLLRQASERAAQRPFPGGVSHLPASQQLGLPVASALCGFTLGTTADTAEQQHNKAMRRRRISRNHKQAGSCSSPGRRPEPALPSRCQLSPPVHRQPPRSHGVPNLPQYERRSFATDYFAIEHAETDMPR